MWMRSWGWATPNTLLWHIDYLDQKALEKQQMQEGLSELPFSTSKPVVKVPWEEKPPWTEKNILSPDGSQCFVCRKVLRWPLVSISFLHVFPCPGPTVCYPWTKLNCLLPVPQFIILCFESVWGLGPYSFFKSSFSFLRLSCPCKNHWIKCACFSLVNVWGQFNS